MIPITVDMPDALFKASLFVLGLAFGAAVGLGPGRIKHQRIKLALTACMAFIVGVIVTYVFFMSFVFTIKNQIR